MNLLSYLKHSDAFLTCHHSFVQDKREERGTALLGLTLRGMQVYQVRTCVSVLLAPGVYISVYTCKRESAFAQIFNLAFTAKKLTRCVRNVWACPQQQCIRR